jgi:HPt (histidine-containing phosphotransfer) domain-containing protein
VESPAPPSTPAATFDAKALMENLGDDKSMLAEVVRLCRNTDAPRLLKDLADALAAGNCVAAGRAAHGLKGMVGAFNATTAWNLAKHLETSAREERLEVLLADADEFVRSLRALIEDLERYAEIEHKFVEWI